ncbi:hypothetical protein RclHR1_10200009 [Rhizophagus clarus]|uniref:DUF221-domain-containing protein n=1 Tax=Rhizophagus clarus TaxID=94130 RepID=A0A2Z6Q5J8_9GLOM|nr:hypothetical protein RclHR1_10200009 [Rhizophagus clarus]GES88653.1 DUF221-domain-containing protein [Rhizophagus clarus]
MSDQANEQQSADSSISTFTSSLIFNAVITIVIFVAFDILRKRNKKVYEPRTYLVPERNRSEPLPPGLFAWVLPVLRIPDDEVIKRIGLDSYMFLRFMRMFMIIFSIFSVFGLPILLPVNFVNQGNNQGLEKFTIGNIRNPKRLWSHVILAWLFSGILMYYIYRELNTFIRLRHEYHTTDEYRNSPRATTILVTGIPNEMNNSESLKELFDLFPGGVKQIWLNRDPSKLTNVTAKREAIVFNLEGAATNYITQYAKDLSKSQSKESNAENGNSPNTKRPQHSSKLPIIGKKVDSLETYSNELSDINKQISELQKDPNDFKRLNSAFIQFNDYVGSQLAATLTIPKLNNISPDDIIWENLNLTNNQRMIRRVISISIVTGLVIVWMTAVTFVASISTLSELAKILPFPFLKGLNNAQGNLKVVVGIIQGILPAVALNILMMVLVIVLRLLSKFEGNVTNSGVDLSLQGKYFFHLVVNVLLVTTFANGIFKSLPELIKNPTQAVEILANNLPRASTFFLTYVLLTMTACALEIFQIAPLIVNFVFRKFLVKTPRKIWDLEKTMPFQDWGTGFPPHIIIACIGIVYSTIQPIVLPIVAIHFALYYLVYRHQFLYVYDKLNQTGGLLFPKGIYEVFAGIFIFQLTLIGLMFLNEGFAQGILSIILFVLSIGVLLAIRHIFKHNPKADFLPVDLMGIIDMKTRKLLVGKHQNKQESIRNDDGNNDENDDYVRTDVVHINEGDEKDLDDYGYNAFTHPAFVSTQPSVWIPDDQNISDDMINKFRKDGIKATNHGTSLDKNYKVVLDIDKIPLEFRDDQFAKKTKAEKKRELKQLNKRINDIEEEIGEM